MKKPANAKSADKYTRDEKIKKRELLRLIRVLVPQHGAAAVKKGAKKSPAAGAGKKPAKVPQGQTERNLLRSYFVMRIAQSCGNTV